MTHSYGTNPSHAHAHVGATPAPNGSDESDDAPVVRSSGSRTRTLVPSKTLDHPQPDTRGVVPEAEVQFLAEGFGAYLRATRKEVGLTQERASQLSGLTVSHLSKLERGNRRPGVPAIKALARILAPADEVTAMEQRLAGLAGDSLREGANRRKLEADNRGRREAVADLERHATRLRNRFRRQEAAGQIVNGQARNLAEQMARTADKLKAIPEQKPEAIAGFEPERIPMPRIPRKMSGRRTLTNLTAFLEDDE